MKKFKKLLSVAVVCAFSMLALAACGKSDKEKVFDAFESLANAKEFDVADAMGIKGVLEGLEDKAFEAGLEITLEESDVYELSMLKSGKVEMSVASDPKAEKAKIDLGVGMAGLNLVSLEGYFDDKQIAVKVPELIDKVFVLDYSGELLTKIKDSALIKLSGVDTTQFDEIFKMYEDALKNSEGQTEALLEIVEYCTAFEKETKAYADFKDAIEVVAIDAEEFEINGKDKKCDGYEIVIPTEAVVDLCKEAIEYYVMDKDAQDLWKGYMEDVMSSVVADASTGAAGYEDESVDQFIAEYDNLVKEYEANSKEIWKSVEDTVKDIEMEMFIYEGEIASLAGEIVMEAEEEKVKIPFELVCTGGENSIYDNFELEIDLAAMDTPKLVMTRETESDKDVYETVINVSFDEYMGLDYSLTYDKEDSEVEIAMDIDADYESMGFYVTAAVEELKKDKSFTLDIDEIKLVIEDETLVELSGEFYVSDDVDIKMPSGDTVDVLMKDEAELQNVLMEIMTAIQSFSAMFQ